MSDIEKAIKRLLVPGHIPSQQNDRYLAKLEEKKEDDLHEQKEHV